MKEYTALAANSAGLILILALRPPEIRAQTVLPIDRLQSATPTALPQTTPNGMVQPSIPPGSVKPKPDRNVSLTNEQCRGLGGVVVEGVTTTARKCLRMCRTVDNFDVIRQTCITEKSFGEK